MLSEIIVCTVAYIILVGIFYPRHKATVPATIPAAEQPINYFPEPEPEVEIKPELKPQPVAQQPKAKATLSSLLREEVGKDAPSNDLQKLGVRELYRLCKAQGVKNYTKLTKSQLIAALA